MSPARKFPANERCFRCGAADAAPLEVGEPAMVVALCRDCGFLVNARPAGSYQREAADRRGEMGNAARPWGSIPADLHLSRLDFLRTTVAMLGEDRARAALGYDPVPVLRQLSALRRGSAGGGRAVAP